MVFTKENMVFTMQKRNMVFTMENMVFTMQKRNMAFTMENMLFTKERSGGGKALFTFTSFEK